MWEKSYERAQESHSLPFAFKFRVARIFASLSLALAAVSASQDALPRTPAEPVSNDATKAAFLYRFASYVEWPADAANADEFVIAVAGGAGVHRQLALLLPKLTIRGARAVVRSARLGDLSGVSILYIGKGALARTLALRRAAITRPILVVTDDADGLDAGGVINFVAGKSAVHFEISLIAADRAGLTIDAALLSVAVRVEQRPVFDETQ